MAMTEKARDTKIAKVQAKIDVLEREIEWLENAPVSTYGQGTAQANGSATGTDESELEN